MARKPKVADTFAKVNDELHATLGKPDTKRGIRRYPVPPDPKMWIDRIHAAGGSAALCKDNSAQYLCVVDGPPSRLMDFVTWVSWQSKSARNALDALHDEVGLRVEKVAYTSFVMRLGRVPSDPDTHAKRFAKIVMNGDAARISSALQKRRWNTGT